MVRLRVGQRRGQRSFDPLAGQRLHDHAGGKRQHLFGLAAQLLSHGLTHCQRPLPAILARTGVGIAGIHHQRTHRQAAGQMAAAQMHRCGAEAVAGKHPDHLATFRQFNQQHVFSARLFDGSFSVRQGHAGDREQGGGVNRSKIHGHGNSWCK